MLDSKYLFDEQGAYLVQYGKSRSVWDKDLNFVAHLDGNKVQRNRLPYYRWPLKVGDTFVVEDALS